MIIKNDNFRGDLSSISAKTATLVQRFNTALEALEALVAPQISAATVSVDSEAEPSDVFSNCCE